MGGLGAWLLSGWRAGLVVVLLVGAAIGAGMVGQGVSELLEEEYRVRVGVRRGVSVVVHEAAPNRGAVNEAASGAELGEELSRQAVAGK